MLLIEQFYQFLKCYVTICPLFFEKLGLADKEKIHSQIISWLFSQELQLIDKSTKKALYLKLFKCELPENYAVYTEWKNMDVVFLDLTGDKPKEALVIENKLKSELHSNAIRTDLRVLEFAKNETPSTLIAEELSTGKADFNYKKSNRFY